MKTILQHPLLLTLVVALLALPLRAQNTNAQTDGGNPPPPSPQVAAGQRGPMARLSDAERATLKAAHDAAIQKDPSLKQAMKDAHEAIQKARKAINDARIAVDPSVEPILAKMARLSDAESATLKAAYDAAIQKDPLLEQTMKDAYQAMQKARKAINDAMIAVDPSVEPILAKMAPSSQVWWLLKGNEGPVNGPRDNQARPWKHDGPGHGMAGLTEGEREQLKAAHEKVRNDPSVIAAREAKRNAATPEARHAAEEALRKASRDAMIKADPSLGPILEKLRPAGGGGDGAPQTEGGGMMQAQ